MLLAILATGLFAALASPAAWSRTVLDLDVQRQPVALEDWGDYWIDASAKLTALQVAAGAGVNWQPTDRNAIYKATAGSVLWIRFTVPPAPDAERWYVELPYSSINRASLYTLDMSGQWNEQKAGDLVAVSKWPVPHRHPLLPIAVSAETPSQYLLRLENGHRFSAPLQFVSEGFLNHSEQRVSLILGIFFGLAGLAVLVSAISAISLRDHAYGWYALSVTLMALTQATLTGIAGLHLWPDAAWWNDVSTSVLPTLELASTLMFVSAAISLPERSLRLHRGLMAVAVLGVVMAVALALVPVERRMGIFSLYVFLPQVLAVYAMAWAWKRGDRFAPWLMIGLSPILIAGAWLMARNAGLVPISFMTMHGSQLGVAIELPIVMVILMLRSQHRRENTRRIQGLDRVDPATGLINGHVFAERLMRMIARSERLKHQSAVMIIDIVNTDQIQRDFGRKAAEDLPLRVAERLLSTAREIDSAARLSERRFGMLVDGPFSAEDAATLGPRIVARCLMPYKGMHVDCIAQVRIAYALVPYQGSNAQGVLTALEEKLASVSIEDRKAVFMLGETTPSKRRRQRPRPERQTDTV
ncbi:7TM diverse intracellular signaling domain-containing protein [Polaromonas sp.]|uniref:sensor domain-containing diguanylate cyclase n=1 Tax=Polaromonas sp. TaxID=1869339 RepID=UPI0025E943A1|nr:7TM diverse intracellular signaling domain-containing protein [Polaromonas sp.]